MSTSTSQTTAQKTAKKRVAGRTNQPVRLYVKGAFVGYRRSQSNQYAEQALIAIDGVKTARDTQFYWGKRVAYIYRATRAIKGSHYRVIWGRIASPHGNNGLVKAKFAKNLPGQAMAASVRIFLYPSAI